MQSRLAALLRPSNLLTGLRAAPRKLLAREQIIPLRQASTLTSTTTPMSESYGNFDRVVDVKLDYTDVRVSRWRSRVTGLNVVHLDYEGL